MPDVNRPSDLSCASRSFCSRTSARRLRNSERWTKPTVCDLSKSSAEVAEFVNDRGVDVRLGGSVDMILKRQEIIEGNPVTVARMSNVCALRRQGLPLTT